MDKRTRRGIAIMSGDVPSSLPPIADDGRHRTLRGPSSHAPCRVSAATRNRAQAQGETIGGRRALLACRDEDDEPSLISIEESSDSSRDNDDDIEHNIRGARAPHRKQGSRSQYYFGTVIVGIMLFFQDVTAEEPRAEVHLGTRGAAMGMHRRRELLEIETPLESLEREEELLPPKREANRREPKHDHVPTKEDAGTLEDVLLSFQDATAEEIKLEIDLVEERKRIGRSKKASGTERAELRMHRNMELLKVETLLESLELEAELLRPGTGLIKK